MLADPDDPRESDAPQRAREDRRVLEAIGLAAASERQYALGLTREQAAFLVSTFWSGGAPLTERAMRRREAVLREAHRYFGIRRKVGPRHRGRRPETAEIVEQREAQRALPALVDLLHKRAAKRGITGAEADRVVSAALRGDPNAQRRLQSGRVDRRVQGCVRAVMGAEEAGQLRDEAEQLRNADADALAVRRVAREFAA